MRSRASRRAVGAGWGAGTRKGPRIAEGSRASVAAPTPCWVSETECGIVVRWTGGGPASGGEGATATAAAGRIGVLERESRALHRRDVVDRHAAQVLRREGVDEHLEAVLIEDQIVLGARVLDEEPVLEATATAGLHADAQAALVGRDALSVHELLHLGRRHGRYGERDL